MKYWFNHPGRPLVVHRHFPWTLPRKWFSAFRTREFSYFDSWGLVLASRGVVLCRLLSKSRANVVPQLSHWVRFLLLFNSMLIGSRFAFFPPESWGESSSWSFRFPKTLEGTSPWFSEVGTPGTVELEQPFGLAAWFSGPFKLGSRTANVSRGSKLKTHGLEERKIEYSLFSCSSDPPEVESNIREHGDTQSGFWMEMIIRMILLRSSSMVGSQRWSPFEIHCTREAKGS